MTEERTPQEIDWRLTTQEGSRREQIARWSPMPLDEILKAQEEVADLARHSCGLGASHRERSRGGPGQR